MTLNKIYTVCTVRVMCDSGWKKETERREVSSQQCYNICTLLQKLCATLTKSTATPDGFHIVHLNYPMNSGKLEVILITSITQLCMQK